MPVVSFAVEASELSRSDQIEADALPGGVAAVFKNDRIRLLRSEALIREEIACRQ